MDVGRNRTDPIKKERKLCPPSGYLTYRDSAIPPKVRYERCDRSIRSPSSTVRYGPIPRLGDHPVVITSSGTED